MGKDNSDKDITIQTTLKILSTTDRLDSFIHDNLHLFEVIGVFAAVTVYLSTAGSTLVNAPKTLADILALSGFAILLICSLVLYARLGMTVLESEQTALHPQNLWIIIFAFPFLFLILSVYIIISQYQGLLAGAITLFIIFIAYLLILYSIDWVANLESVGTLNDEKFGIPGFPGWMLLGVYWGIWLIVYFAIYKPVFGTAAPLFTSISFNNPNFPEAVLVLVAFTWYIAGVILLVILVPASLYYFAKQAI